MRGLCLSETYCPRPIFNFSAQNVLRFVSRNFLVVYLYNSRKTEHIQT